MEKRYYIATVTIVLLLLASYVVFLYIPALKSEKRLTDALRSHNAGDLDGSIQKFESADSGSMTPNGVYVRLFLARNLSRRNKDDDRTRAIQIYKDTAQNTSIAVNQRALSLSLLLDRYNGTRDSETLKKIFSGEPLEKFLTNGDYNLAIRKSYEYASSIRPLSLIEYQIGNWYGQQLRNGKISQSEKEQYIGELRSAIARGEALEPDIDKFSSVRHYVSHTYRVKALDQVALAEATNTSYENAESTFRYALSITSTSETAIEWLNHDLRLRYDYAAFLARTDGKNRLADIKDLLDPLFNPPKELDSYPFSIYEYFKNVANEPENSILRKDMVSLAKVYSPFANYLPGLGVDLGN